MTTTPPEDLAALFDLPPEPASAPSAESAAEALEAAEAALAAELASEIDAGGVAADAPDSRTSLRVEVSWPARVRLAQGDVIELKVRNISESGVGLVSEERIPADTVVDFDMEVPPLGESGEATLVEGTIKTTYTVARGRENFIGGTWVHMPAAGLDLVNAWIRQAGR